MDRTPGLDSAEPLRGYKTHLYEGGIRSPLVVWAPGLMNKNLLGSVNKTSVFSAIDLVPSLADLCKALLPKKVIFDGEELTDVLLRKSDKLRKTYLFPSPTRPRFLLRREKLARPRGKVRKWKLLCEYDGSMAELYDLSTDQGESNNLAGKHPEICDQLVEQVTNWHNSMPADNGPKLTGK